MRRGVILMKNKALIMVAGFRRFRQASVVVMLLALAACSSQSAREAELAAAEAARIAVEQEAAQLAAEQARLQAAEEERRRQARLA